MGSARPGVWVGVILGVGTAVAVAITASSSSGDPSHAPPGDRGATAVSIGGAAGAPADTAAASMNDRLRFVPDTIAIEAGQTIEWTNDSQLIHTVTADPEKVAREENVALPEGAEPFDSGVMRPGETFAHTFDTPGEYVYFCIPHEAAGMVGVVRVEPADPSSTKKGGP